MNAEERERERALEGRSEPRQERARPCRMWSFTAAYTRRLGLRLLRRRTDFELLQRKAPTRFNTCE